MALHHETPLPERAVDLREYWLIVRKRWWLALGAVAVVVAVMGAMTLRKPRVFQATASVVIDPNAPRVLDPNVPEVMQLGTGNFWTNSEYYNTQYRIIRSRALAEAVVRKHSYHHDARLTGKGATQVDDEERLISAAAGMLQGKIRVLPVKDSRVVGIAVRDGNAAFAAELANSIANVYIEQNLALKLQTTRDAKRWVAEQLDEARRTLEKSEQALYAFRRDNEILSVSLEDRQNMLASTLVDFNNGLTATRKQKIELQARRRAVASLVTGDNPDTQSTFGPHAGQIETLRRTFLDERRKLQQLDERFGPKHPERIAQAVRVESARADLVREAKTVVSVMDAEIGALSDAEQRYTAELEKLTQEALGVNKKEIDYTKLRREADNAAQVYASLIKRHNESGLQEQDQGNNIRLLDRALVPGHPVEPNLRNAAALTVVLALLLALGLVFFIEFMDRTVKTQQDVEALVGAPFLGFLPSVADGERGADLFVLRHPKSTAAECTRVVRTNILFLSPDKPVRTMLVTSSNPVEGKTLNAVNLGIAMAQGGRRTLLVDTDMRRPRLHKVLGTPNDHGVSRLIVEEGPIEEAIKTTEVPGLWLLPCGPIPPNPAELLETEKFRTLVKKLTDKFDMVIFDSPPALAVTDAAVLSRVVDGALIVVRAGTTTRDAVMQARARLRSVNATVIGAVLNDVNLRNPHYATYYYQYQYKYQESPAPPAVEGKRAAGG